MPTGVCFGLLPHKNTVAPNPSSNHKESLKPGLLNKHITRDEELPYHVIHGKGNPNYRVIYPMKRIAPEV
jgi:hypothetical protein